MRKSFAGLRFPIGHEMTGATIACGNANVTDDTCILVLNMSFFDGNELVTLVADVAACLTHSKSNLWIACCTIPPRLRGNLVMSRHAGGANASGDCLLDLIPHCHLEEDRNSKINLAHLWFEEVFPPDKCFESVIIDTSEAEIE